MFKLKDYQIGSLSTLRMYLEAARVQGAQAAFEAGLAAEGRGSREAYRSLAGLEEVPYVCLRLPTGGGKTILASHSVQVAAKAYLEQDYPLVLWLVPTNTIRSQTLEALKKPQHPYREALDNAFEGRVSVFDISEVEQIRPQDLAERVCVVIGTFATLRVNNTEGRRIYSHNENFEPHFSRVPQSAPGMERVEEGAGKGNLKFSFANLLHLHQPLVIVDEAHNAVSKLMVEEVWQRIRPACIIEFTATPVTNNVLYRVSASQVKAAEMIKLPIMLTEHQNWQEALHDAILTRNKLQEAAENEREYIRPLALFQAESIDRELTVAVIRQHLIDNEGIDPEKIAVATGTQRELDGINLFDPACRIEYIITVEALKEGWDCSFAYVFCTVANIHSSKDVEQFLGRVMRMPYAKRRVDDQLNRSYAHVASPCFADAARLLHDRLVEKMGFDEAEAQAFIQHKQPELLDNGPLFKQPAAKPLILTLADKPDFTTLPQEVQARIEVTETADGVQITVSGEITEELEEQLVQSIDNKNRGAIRNIIKTHRHYQQRTLTPAERGEQFNVPRLCVELQGELELAEKELFLDACGWNLIEYPAELSEAEFSIQETSRTFEMDIREKHLVYGLVDNERQIDLAHVHTEWNEVALARILDKELRQPDIKQEVMLEFLRRVVVALEKQRGIELSVQVRFKYPLIKALAAKITDYRLQALKRGYQETLFGATAKVETSFDYAVTFGKDGYAPSSCYRGRYLFRKHFYPVVGDLEPSGEEFDCAQIIDSLPQVKYWVRNLVGQPHASFWLPTATDRFYPDFVAELADGRVLVIEYKGAHLISAADASEKIAIGELWERNSAGKALFMMVQKVDDIGRTVRLQLSDKLKTII